MTIPTHLSELHQRLAAAIAVRGLMEYTYSDGDACCEDHDGVAEYTSTDPEHSAATRIATAWVQAKSNPWLGTGPHPSEVLSALLQSRGDDLNQRPNLIRDRALVENWLNATTPPDSDRLRADLADVLAADLEFLVKPSTSDSDASWEIRADEGSWVERITTGDIEDIVKETVL